MLLTNSAFRPFAIALACTGGLFTAASWIPQEGIAAAAAILFLLLGLPICILLYRDGLRAREAAVPSRAVRSAVLQLPMRVLGGICLLAGLASLAWLAYNLLVERQPQFAGIRSFGQLLLPILLIRFGSRWLRCPLAASQDDRETA